MQKSSKNQKTFFLVDDDVDDQEIFIAAVNEIDNSIKCISIDNCEEALEKLKKEHTDLPDLIFLDLNMPRLNGRQCLSEIRKLSRLKHIPVIIYSTSSLKKDMEETASLGADLFITKPNRFNELCETLNNVLLMDWPAKRYQD
jgi:CheY-like chemotaxis protein